MSDCIALWTPQQPKTTCASVASLEKTAYPRLSKDSTQTCRGSCLPSANKSEHGIRGNHGPCTWPRLVAPGLRAYDTECSERQRGRADGTSSGLVAKQEVL